jgi:hypothetical protein
VSGGGEGSGWCRSARARASRVLRDAIDRAARSSGFAAGGFAGARGRWGRRGAVPTPRASGREAMIVQIWQRRITGRGTGAAGEGAGGRRTADVRRVAGSGPEETLRLRFERARDAPHRRVRALGRHAEVARVNRPDVLAPVHRGTLLGDLRRGDEGVDGLPGLHRGESGGAREGGARAMGAASERCAGWNARRASADFSPGCQTRRDPGARIERASLGNEAGRRQRVAEPSLGRAGAGTSPVIAFGGNGKSPRRFFGCQRRGASVARRADQGAAPLLKRRSRPLASSRPARDGEGPREGRSRRGRSSRPGRFARADRGRGEGGIRQIPAEAEQIGRCHA